MHGPFLYSTRRLSQDTIWRALALFPVLVAGIWNTGNQYLKAIGNSGTTESEGWQATLGQSLATQLEPSGHASFFAAIVSGGAQVLPILLLAGLVGGLWERIFSNYRDKPFEHSVWLIAITFTLLMPPDVGVWHIIWGMTFAVVIGRAIFGGDGHTFIHPAVLGVVTLQVSYPTVLTAHPLWTQINGYAGTTLFAQLAQGGDVGLNWMQAFIGGYQDFIGVTSVLAICLGAVVLIMRKLIVWQLLVAQCLGLVVASWLCNILISGLSDNTFPVLWYWHLLLGSFAFCAVFVATDPSSAAATTAGRWIQGLFLGALVVVLRVLNPSHHDAVVVAVLLTNVITPLIDHIVIWQNVHQRRKRCASR